MQKRYQRAPSVGSTPTTHADRSLVCDSYWLCLQVYLHMYLQVCALLSTLVNTLLLYVHWQVKIPLSKNTQGTLFIGTLSHVGFGIKKVPPGLHKIRTSVFFQIFLQDFRAMSKIIDKDWQEHETELWYSLMTSASAWTLNDDLWPLNVFTTVIEVVALAMFFLIWLALLSKCKNYLEFFSPQLWGAEEFSRMSKKGLIGV